MKTSFNEIFGIFPGPGGTEFCLLRRKKRTWFREQLPAEHSVGGDPLEETRNMLKLTGYSKKRCVCLGLPREQVFMREVSFPNLSEEQALDSARLGIGLYCHLEQDEIYHDEWVFMRGDVPCVIIAYTLRRTVDAFIEAVEDAGYARHQITVAPVTVGLDILIRKFAPDELPCVAVGSQGEKLVFSLHGGTGWEGSHFTDRDAPAMDMVPAGFGKAARTPTFHIGEAASLSVGVVDAKPLDNIMKNSVRSESSEITWGLCAAALGLSGYPALVFQEGVRKRPFRLDINAFQVLVVLLALILVFLTGDLVLKLDKATDELAELQQVEARLADRVAPLQTTLDELEEVRTRVEQIKEFATGYAMPLGILKVLAETTPRDTWIKNFNFRHGSLRLSAEGGSAIETMQAWRGSPFFSSVKLTSPVTKNRKQQDRFTVDIAIAGRGKK